MDFTGQRVLYVTTRADADASVLQPDVPATFLAAPPESVPDTASFDVVLVDRSLPRDRRGAVIEALRERGGACPIVPFSEPRSTADDAPSEDPAPPAAGGEPAVVAEEATGVAPSFTLHDGRALRVLVVDDDPFALRLNARVIQSAGYEVVTAANGVEAMRVLLDQGAHIAVSDWLMPEMDGMELCRALRADEFLGYIYFMVLTAQAEKSRLSEAFDAGVDDYLTKPFDRGELLARLRAGSRIVALEAEATRHSREIIKVNAEMAVLNERLQKLATTDALTGLFNRRKAMEKLSDLWNISKRYDMSFSCIMLDVDKFKNFNDTHGHAAGDVVLKEVARTIQSAARGTDVSCRVGGEEFLVIAPNTDAESAAVLAERIRCEVEAASILHAGTELNVTVSLGVAELGEDTSDPDQLVKVADDALYAAKAAGRNRYVVAAAIPACSGAADRA